MKMLIGEFVFSAICVVFGIIALNSFLDIYNDNNLQKNLGLYDKRNEDNIDVNYIKPDVNADNFKIFNNELVLNEQFNLENHIKVTATDGTILNDFVTLEKSVDTTKVGITNVKFILRWNGKTIIKKSDFIIRDELKEYKIYGEGNMEMVKLYKGDELYRVGIIDDGHFMIDSVEKGEYILKYNDKELSVSILDEDLQLGVLQ